MRVLVDEADVRSGPCSSEAGPDGPDWRAPRPAPLGSERSILLEPMFLLSMLILALVLIVAACWRTAGRIAGRREFRACPRRPPEDVATETHAVH